VTPGVPTLVPGHGWSGGRAGCRCRPAVVGVRAAPHVLGALGLPPSTRSAPRSARDVPSRGSVPRSRRRIEFLTDSGDLIRHPAALLKKRQGRNKLPQAPHHTLEACGTDGCAFKSRQPLPLLNGKRGASEIKDDLAARPAADCGCTPPSDDWKLFELREGGISGMPVLASRSGGDDALGCSDSPKDPSDSIHLTRWCHIGAVVWNDQDVSAEVAAVGSHLLEACAVGIAR
jgi:hypothetical protein